MTTCIQVLTTTETQAQAQTIAEALVEKRLAACVQVIGPITSTYWWQDAIEITEEWLCLIKSKQNLYEALEETIIALHPYDTPEILATPVAAGSQRYLAWLNMEVKHPGTE